jgi:hypothetical protein
MAGATPDGERDHERRSAMTFLKSVWSARVAVGILVLLGSSSYLHADDSTSSTNAKSTDSNLHVALREVINQGADLFNQGDQSGSYRLFQGALITARSQLGHHADVQKLIDEGLARSETGSMGKRAWALRRLLDDVRDKINPNPKKSAEKSKSGESSPSKASEKKSDDIKKSDEGKKSEDDKKKDDQKPGDANAPEQKSGSSSKKDDKKSGDTKSSEKNLDDKSKKPEDKSKDK